MNYIWDYVLKAREVGVEERDIVFRPAKVYSPYMELAFEDLNLTECIDKVVEINPYYRYYHIFKYLFQPEDNTKKESTIGSLEFREEFFDIMIHHLLNIDRYMGMNREEFYVLFLERDILHGCFGEIQKSRFEKLKDEEKKLFLHHFLRLYQVGDSILLFQIVVPLFYAQARIYQNTLEKEEVLIYLGVKQRREEEEKIQLLLHTFLPICYAYRIYWEYHFGILGVDETMRLGQIQLY